MHQATETLAITIAANLGFPRIGPRRELKTALEAYWSGRLDELGLLAAAAALRGAIPHGHWRTTTFVAGLHNSSMVAPMVLDGPSNGLAFEAHVDQVLVPELRPGDVVVIDNLGSHKRPGIGASIEAAGASLLYLPPYSPDLNPIDCCARGW